MSKIKPLICGDVGYIPILRSQRKGEVGNTWIFKLCPSSEVVDVVKLLGVKKPKLGDVLKSFSNWTVLSGGISCLGDPVSLTSVFYWPKLGEVYLQPSMNHFLLFFMLFKKSEELQGEFIAKTPWAGDCKLIPDPEWASDYQNCHSWNFKQSKPLLNLFSLRRSPLIFGFCCFSNSLSCWFGGN